MPDPRFSGSCHPRSLGDILERLNLEIQSDDAHLMVQGCAPLSSAGPGYLTFFDNKRHVSSARKCRALACLVKPGFDHDLPDDVIRIESSAPGSDFSHVVDMLYPASSLEASISPNAHIDPTSSIGPGCRIDPGAVIATRVTLGQGCHIGSNAVIEQDCEIGEHTHISAGCVIANAIIGNHVLIHANAAIGQDGFGFVSGADGHRKIRQLGRVVIGDETEIGACTTIDRGSLGDTRIGRGCKIDNHVQIAHNVEIGDFCLIVAQSGLAGSTVLKEGCVMAAQSGTGGHLTLGPQTIMAARAAAIKDLPGNATYGGAPAVPIKEWRRQIAMIQRMGKAQKKS